MSSTSSRHGHLDATTGREVVYCHACSHEWYRDEHGLTCPQCEGDVIEIIDPNNDPRDLDHESVSTSPENTPFRYRGYNDDSDPEEADIDEHLGQHGFAFRRSTRDGPNQEHHNPNVDPVMESFLNMIRGFGPPRTATGGLFARAPDQEQNQDQNQEHQGPRTFQRTFRSGPFGGTTSVTIVSGPMPRGRAGGSPGDAQGDPFQAYAQSPPDRPQQHGGIRVTSISMTIGANSNPRIFSNVLRDIGPPGHGQPGEDNFGADGPPAFARSLHDILSLINPANAMAGDAVYSQEALDRIITNLMEANPQSNAAPPATEQGLKNLERKTVDKAMLGSDGKTECSICIDDMAEGETAIFLPCKHWFHEECVVLWLKEHNTCPICRTPIEKNERNNNNNNNNAEGGSGSQNQNRPSPGDRTFSSSSSPGFPRSPWFSGSPSPFPDMQGRNDSSSAENGQQRPVRYSRPPSQSQSRLNQALRNLSSIQQERERTRERDRASASGFSYDTSNLQRRSSHSPTSPRVMGFSEAGARMRQRSPSQSSRRSGADQDQRQQGSGHGPISWLRDRFSGGSGNNSSRDDRQS